MTIFSNLRLTVVMLSAFLVVGCATAAIEGAQATKSEIIISQNINEARVGNSKAQFTVGEAYCCSLHEGSGIYNTKTSVEWLCKSARQSYSPAMFKLGKIYSGDTIDGIRLARRAAAGVAGTSTNLPVAAAWFKLAEVHGEPNAANRLADIWAELSANDQRASEKIFEKGLSAPCLWNEVIPVALSLS